MRQCWQTIHFPYESKVLHGRARSAMELPCRGKCRPVIVVRAATSSASDVLVAGFEHQSEVLQPLLELCTWQLSIYALSHGESPSWCPFVVILRFLRNPPHLAWPGSNLTVGRRVGSSCHAFSQLSRAWASDAKISRYADACLNPAQALVA